DGGIEFLRVGFEIRRDLILGGEGIGSKPIEFQARGAIVPCRAICNQRVPTARAPRFGDSATFEDEMRDAERAQVLANCDTGLTSANHKGIDLCFLYWHL